MTMPIARAEPAQIEAFLREHPEWSLREGKLYREFRFGDFVRAFGFMSQVALVAERSDHHPEWFNVYDRVRVELTTHDAGGISARDFALARTMSELASAAGAR